MGLLGTQVNKYFSQVFARGDTTAPSGLLARLCHAFLVSPYKSFTCGWLICVLIANLSRDVAMATKYCCRNVGNLILLALFARSPDVCTVSFRYYLLGGDTAVPSRLLARLCHAFLVSIKFAVYIVWILIYKVWKFGLNQYYHGWNTEFFSWGLTIIGAPCVCMSLYVHCAGLYGTFVISNDSSRTSDYALNIIQKGGEIAIGIYDHLRSEIVLFESVQYFWPDGTNIVPDELPLCYQNTCSHISM